MARLLEALTRSNRLSETVQWEETGEYILLHVYDGDPEELKATFQRVGTLVS